MRKICKVTGKEIIELQGETGNAYCIMAVVKRLCGDLGLNWYQIQDEMNVGDYDNLVTVAKKYVSDHVLFVNLFDGELMDQN